MVPSGHSSVRAQLLAVPHRASASFSIWKGKSGKVCDCGLMTQFLSPRSLSANHTKAARIIRAWSSIRPSVPQNSHRSSIDHFPRQPRASQLANGPQSQTRKTISSQAGVTFIISVVQHDIFKRFESAGYRSPRGRANAAAIRLLCGLAPMRIVLRVAGCSGKAYWGNLPPGRKGSVASQAPWRTAKSPGLAPGCKADGVF